MDLCANFHTVMLFEWNRVGIAHFAHLSICEFLGSSQEFHLSSLKNTEKVKLILPSWFWFCRFFPFKFLKKKDYFSLS